MLPLEQWFKSRGPTPIFTLHLITNVQSGTAIDLDGGNVRNSTGIFGYGVHRGTNQQWEFIGVTGDILSRQIQVPGPELAVEKIISGLERVMEKVVPGQERVVERVIEKTVVNINDSPDTLRELRELKELMLRAMEGWGQTMPKVAAPQKGWK
ncbi:hypothetical protein K440DRAFT_663949 [Wilcoxina mikolae CBS 423.85]|nr:hypothetical protein K440DRAFT_663949 [Wilcoxina mikolae CBS 423.85]